jgi:recombination protein RecA
MAKAKIKNEEADQSSMLKNLCDELNKLNKNVEQKAFILNDTDQDPSKIEHWISTGSDQLDLAISNRPYGGLPVGRIVEIVGLEGTGKSLISGHCIADVQRQGGQAVYIDTENAMHIDYWRSLGVDFDNMIYQPAENVESIFEIIENAIATYRKINRDKMLLIIVDSVAGASTRVELESGYDKDGYNTTKAIVVSKAMRKITNMIGRQKVLLLFTNQLRHNMNSVAFGEKYVVPGGKSIAYHSSVRIKLDTVGKLKHKDKIIGNTCRATVFKNRMGPPHRKAEFDVYYDSGIARYASWIKVLKQESLVSLSGSYYTYIKNNGETVRFLLKDFAKMLNDMPDLKSEIYDKMCEVVILKYKLPNEQSVQDTENVTDEDESSND